MGFLFGNQQREQTQRMPAGNDAVVRAARERNRRSILDRSGRSSTVLTREGSNGTQSYTNSALGSA